MYIQICGYDSPVINRPEDRLVSRRYIDLLRVSSTLMCGMR